MRRDGVNESIFWFSYFPLINIPICAKQTSNFSECRLAVDCAIIEHSGSIFLCTFQPDIRLVYTLSAGVHPTRKPLFVQQLAPEKVEPSDPVINPLLITVSPQYLQSFVAVSWGFHRNIFRVSHQLSSPIPVQNLRSCLQGFTTISVYSGCRFTKVATKGQ